MANCVTCKARCEYAGQHRVKTDCISYIPKPQTNATDRNVGKWIPVTERCPEKSGDYLVFDDCRNLYVNEWHCLLKKWQYDDSRITHWMPLPEPPKEEE